MKVKFSVFLFLIFFLISCGVSDDTRGEFHTILGSDRGFYIEEYNIEVLLDARVGNLQVKQVKMKSPDCYSGVQHHIELSGEIGPDSTAAIKKLLQNIPKCKDINGNIALPTVVYMNSGGGLLKDGFEMGRLFRSLGYIGTVITGGQSCSSSCAIAFLGGTFRFMRSDAEILFHAPYLRLADKSIDCSDKGQVEDLKRYFAYTLKEDGNFLHKRTMDYCSVSTGWVLNADGAKLFGITNRLE